MCNLILIVEVIEHIETKYILKIITSVEKLARKQIIFTSTNTPESIRKNNKNIDQDRPPPHLSLINPKWFLRRGYKVRGFIPQVNYKIQKIIDKLSYIFPLFLLSFYNINSTRVFIFIKTFSSTFK